MPRRFTRGDTDHLYRSAPVTVYPFTAVFRLRVFDRGTNGGVWYLGDLSAVNTERWNVRVNGTGLLTLQSISASGSQTTTGSAIDDDIWYHLAFTAINATDRKVYLDGSSDITQTTSSTPTGIDRLSFGAEFSGGSVTAPQSADMMIVGLYDIELNTDEIQMLADGKSPLRVRRESLVSYFRMWGDADFDLIDGTTLTVGNSPTTRLDNPEGLVRALPRGRSRTYSRR